LSDQLLNNKYKRNALSSEWRRAWMV